MIATEKQVRQQVERLRGGALPDDEWGDLWSAVQGIGMAAVLPAEKAAVFVDRFDQAARSLYGDAPRRGRGADADTPEPSPDWWRFYCEQVARDVLKDDLGATWRLLLGLQGHIPLESIEQFVKERLAQDELEQEFPTGGGRDASEFMPYLRWIEYPVVRDGVRSAERDLVWPGRDRSALAAWVSDDVDAFDPLAAVKVNPLWFVADSARRQAALTGAWPADYIAFWLSGAVPEYPLLSWRERNVRGLTQSVTLTIGSLGVTPDEVRAYYKQVRADLVSKHDAWGDLALPVRKEPEVIELVRWVQAQPGARLTRKDWQVLRQTRIKEGLNGYKDARAMRAVYVKGELPRKTLRRRQSRAKAGGSGNG